MSCINILVPICHHLWWPISSTVHPHYSPFSAVHATTPWKKISIFTALQRKVPFHIYIYIFLFTYIYIFIYLHIYIYIYVSQGWSHIHLWECSRDPPEQRRQHQATFLFPTISMCSDFVGRPQLSPENSSLGSSLAKRKIAEGCNHIDLAVIGETPQKISRIDTKNGPYSYIFKPKPAGVTNLPNLPRPIILGPIIAVRNHRFFDGWVNSGSSWWLPKDYKRWRHNWMHDKCPWCSMLLWRWKPLSLGVGATKTFVGSVVSGNRDVWGKIRAEKKNTDGDLWWCFLVWNWWLANQWSLVFVFITYSRGLAGFRA